jgi:hypothetical protein
MKTRENFWVDGLAERVWMEHCIVYLGKKMTKEKKTHALFRIRSAAH